MPTAPPLALEVRLDAVAAVLLDGLSYRRAGRMVGTCKTEVGDSLGLLPGALGFCQPDGSFITTLDQLGERLAEMTHSGEAVMLDALATRVQRPRGWVNQKVLYDAKRHAHTAQGLALSSVHGDLLWCDGGWPPPGEVVAARPVCAACGSGVRCGRGAQNIQFRGCLPPRLGSARPGSQ